MKLLVAFLLLFVMVPASFARDKKAQNQNPVMWGALSQNTRCVIFKEGHKTSGMFWGVAITTKTVGKLTVIETQNYTLDQDEFLETQEDMDDLMQRARIDHVKLVKIPEKYSPELLDRARAMCEQSQ